MIIALHATYSQVKWPICPTDLIFVLVCSVLQPAAAIGTNIALNTCISMPLIRAAATGSSVNAQIRIKCELQV